MGKYIVSAGLLLVLSVSLSHAQEQGAQAAAKTVFERYTEPIEIFKNGLGTFTRPISSN